MSLAFYRLRGNQKSLVNTGALMVGLLTGGIAYFNYRVKLTKDFLIGHGHNRMDRSATNKTPYKSMWLTWYRMPDEEYDVYHKFMPYYVIGQLDYDKEILIPSKRRIGGQTVRGYDVVNPLYCYDSGVIDFESAQLDKEKISDTDRAAIIVNRGWIPESMKDRSTRPWEKTSRQLIRIPGTFLQAKNIHDYKRANNPNTDEWYNLAPEDLARYWELSNFNELKQFYFQHIALAGEPGMGYKFPIAPNSDDVIRDYYNWWMHEKWNQLAYYTMGPVSALSLAVFLLTV